MDQKHQTVPVRLGLCAVVIRVAAKFVFPFLAVRNSVTTLYCLYAAPWWRTGELTYRAAAWTGSGGWLSSCRRMTVSEQKSYEYICQNISYSCVEKV